jgi:hypothetical protein
VLSWKLLPLVVDAMVVSDSLTRCIPLPHRDGRRAVIETLLAEEPAGAVVYSVYRIHDGQGQQWTQRRAFCRVKRLKSQIAE